MFSILIPTFNNINYLKLCIKSLNKNSKYNHEIIIHVNDGSDGTLDFVKEKKIKFTFSENNIGLCSSLNKAAFLSNNKFILYSHDDMYFCPQWDDVLYKEIENLKNQQFYLSGVMIQKKMVILTLTVDKHIMISMNKSSSIIIQKLIAMTNKDHILLLI